ncbi:MAG: PKD domain-containing protein, partial [Saprospiraceae bacterium]|nr:PKD domain-containing protein [Saprospiraceae bacterium]
DANAVATAQNAHNPGQTIAGMSDYLGLCIDDNDLTSNPPGLDTFCTCVTAPGMYTLASLGDSTNVGKGDEPKFRLQVHQTLHDSRPAAETVSLGPLPGAYSSQPDVFSCTDNLGAMPPCGDRKKLIFRQFYLPEPAVVTISETGNTTSVLSLFAGQATDPAAVLTPVGTGCFTTNRFYDDCTPLPAGWYTVVSYGRGPNYTDKRVWNNLGERMDVGKASRISIALDSAIVPKFNRPAKAYAGGTTDWTPAQVNSPNAVTGRLYTLGTERFCDPDTPFIPTGILPCAPNYNRVAFYTFTITRPSFVQIRSVDLGFYVEVFPFNVSANPAGLLTVPPVYQCLSIARDYRQLCDLPPGAYTIAIFANDSHKGASLTPQLYVEAVEKSRFDDASQAYNHDLIPPNDVWQNGRVGDLHPTLPTEHPSRDVFYCSTGARSTDPVDTRCNTQLNPLIYAGSIPQPLFLPGSPPSPVAQPWRNLWYTFVLEGSGTASIRVNLLTPGTARPLMAVYESPLDANQAWSDLKALGDAALATGLVRLDENVNAVCDADGQFGGADLLFDKSGCVKNRVRYFVVVSFDADEPNFPNQVISVSIKYDGATTLPALYDETVTANAINGLGQMQPPYDTVPLTPGATFTGPDFSLLCYTENPTDPAVYCGSNDAKSAWFRFEVATTGKFYAALAEIGVANGWFANTTAMTVWQETAPGGSLVQLPLAYEYVSGEHEWVSGCIGPGVYYLLVRSCLSIDSLQLYRPVIRLTDSPGDFCTNAVPLDVPGFAPVSIAASVDCHTIGTDFGETTTTGMGCLFGPAGKKTTWFRVRVTAGPKVNLNFSLAENLTPGSVNLNALAYRVFAGSCGALTPVFCSAVGSNSITQNCLGSGDYYVQVAMPEKVVNTRVTGTISLTVTAQPNSDQVCAPTNPNAPQANFSPVADCHQVAFVNSSTAGSDIVYLWQFADGSTSALAEPVWLPPGQGSYPVTLTVTNISNGLTAMATANVSVSAPFADYLPLRDTVVCNAPVNLVLNAGLPGASYLWNDQSTEPTLTVQAPGAYSVRITKDGCELSDTVLVTAADARRTINPTLCPGDSLV